MVKDLTIVNPSTVLWKFSLPLFGSIVFQQLYNIADSFVAGKYIGEHALAAVGNSYEVTLIYLAFAFGCNIGCSVVVSRFFGAKQNSSLKTAVNTTFISTAILCAVLTLLGFTLTPSLLRLMNTPENLMADTLTYLNIYTGGLIFLFFYNISTGIFSALGDSKTPFFFLAASSVANIFMDIWFVCQFKMGVAGVAWATFICQSISCILAFITVLARMKKIECTEKHKIFSGMMLREISRIAIPSILQQSFVSVGNIIIQGIINSYGAEVMAGYAAAIKLNNFAITSFTTLGNGMSNFTAQNMGAEKSDRVKQGYRGGVIMILCIAIPFTLIYSFMGETMVNIFMNSESAGALTSGVLFLSIVSPFYAVISMKLISDGVLRGAGAMNHFMVATFTDLLLRVILAYIFSDNFGYIGIWWSWPVGWIIAAAMSLIFYFKGVWLKSHRTIKN